MFSLHLPESLEFQIWSCLTINVLKWTVNQEPEDLTSRSSSITSNLHVPWKFYLTCLSHSFYVWQVMIITPCAPVVFGRHSWWPIYQWSATFSLGNRSSVLFSFPMAMWLEKVGPTLVRESSLVKAKYDGRILLSLRLLQRWTCDSVLLNEL